MQTVSKTQLLAEEAAQAFMNGSDREIRNCLKQLGRAVTRRLIIAIYLAGLAAPKADLKHLVLESVNAFSHLDSKKIEGIVKLLEHN